MSKLWWGAQIERAHEGEAARAHDAMDFQERRDWVCPEMDDANGEDSVKAGIGEGHVLGGGEMKVGSASGDEGGVEAVRLVHHG